MSWWILPIVSGALCIGWFFLSIRRSAYRQGVLDMRRYTEENKTDDRDVDTIIRVEKALREFR